MGLSQVQQYRRQQGGGGHHEPGECPSRPLFSLSARLKSIAQNLQRSAVFGAPAPHLGGGGVPPSPLNPAQLGLSGGEITRGVDARGRPVQYLRLLEDKLQELQRDTDGIFSINIRSDRDASEVNRRARSVLQMADELDGDLVTELKMWKTDSDMMSRLYNLRVSLSRIRDRLKKDSQRILDDRGMQTADVRANVSRPKVFAGSGTPLDFLDWKKAAERYHAACRLSEEQQVLSYQHELTSGMPKEIISQLRSTNVIIQTLTNRYGNKRGLVEGFKADLMSIKRPDENKDAAAADYVAAALAKLEYLLRLARVAGLVYELAMLRREQVVLNTMRGHPTLRSFEMMFGRLYGEASRQSGFVSAEDTFEILLTCLREADQALLYIKTNSISYNAAVKRDNGGNATSSGHSGGGGGKGGGSNKANGKQINQTAASKKQQGNGGNSNSGNGGNGGKSNSGPPKQQRKCPYCASLVASHGHVLECRKFENVPAEMMYKFCHQLSACTSCLLTNQYTDWNKRGAWFTAHEPSCNRDFVCRVGDCGSKSPMYQAHVVVCYEHHVENKARIDDFQKTSAAYTNMQFYAFPSHLKEGKA